MPFRKMRNLFAAVLISIIPGVTAYAFDASPNRASDIGHATLFLHSGFSSAGLDCVNQAVSLTDNSFTTSWLKAEALFADADFAGALSVYRSLYTYSQLSPSLEAILLRMGDCRLGMAGDDNISEIEKALAIYQSVDKSRLSTKDSNALAFRTGYCKYLLAQDADDADADNAFSEAEQYFKAVTDGELKNMARYLQAQCLYERGLADEALAALPQYVSQLPAGYLSAAGAHMNFAAGNYSEAAESARRALATLAATSAQRNEMKRIYGESLFNLGDKQEGIEQLRSYLETEPEPVASALLRVATDDYLKTNYDDAIPRLEAASNADGTVGQTASLLLGQALMHTGRQQAAVLAFDKALNIDGGDDDVRQAAYYNYAAAASKGNNVPFGSSAAVFEQFLAEYPHSRYADRSRIYLADGYIAEGEYQRALDCLNNIQFFGTHTDNTRKRVLYLLGMQQLDNSEPTEALNYFTQALNTGSSRNSDLNNEIILGQAFALTDADRVEESLPKFSQYLANARHDAQNRPAATYHYAYALFNRQRYNEANRYFAAAESSFDGARLADILNRRADIAYYNEDFAGAEALYRRALAAEQSSGDYAAFNAARMAGFQRNYQKKLNELNSFFNSYPNSALVPEAMLEKTQALLSLGRRQDAVDVYRRLTSDYPLTAQSRRGYLQLAMTLLDMNRRDEACEAYREVISRYPSSAEAAQASTLLRQMYALEGRGEEYLSFIQSIEGAPAIERTDEAELVYGSATRALANGDHGEALQRFVDQYPDAPQAEQALASLAQTLYDDGEIPRSLQLWQQLAQRASTPEMNECAQLGIMRAARDCGDNELAGNTAALLLQSPGISASALAEAKFSRGLALCDDVEQACQIWLANPDMAEPYGIKGAFYAAEALADDGQDERALGVLGQITSSRTPHHYWVARAFILQSDILLAQGHEFEAREYLRALRQNYPGSETDITDMINQRLPQQ